jgi:hypothetical protein
VYVAHATCYNESMSETPKTPEQELEELRQREKQLQQVVRDREVAEALERRRTLKDQPPETAPTEGVVRFATCSMGSDKGRVEVDDAETVLGMCELASRWGRIHWVATIDGDPFTWLFADAEVDSVVAEWIIEAFGYDDESESEGVSEWSEWDFDFATRSWRPSDADLASTAEWRQRSLREWADKHPNPTDELPEWLAKPLDTGEWRR